MVRLTVSSVAGLVAALGGAGVNVVVSAWTEAGALFVLAAYVSYLAADLVNPTPMALLWPYLHSWRPGGCWPEGELGRRPLRGSGDGVCAIVAVAVPTVLDVVR